PVRFVGNYSSGKMGLAIAEACYEQGANVNLVCGPVTCKAAYGGIRVTSVVSANDMYTAVHALFPGSDVAVMAAAVADYAPAERSNQKIKKTEEKLDLELIKTPDILKSIGAAKTIKQLVVGFALETENERENALQKLLSKNADLIVLNSLRDAAAGFGKDTNKVTIFDRTQKAYVFEAKSKKLVANDIVDLITKMLNEKM
ncbi:MAG: phosphopantothenoylcysteine decarboxylase, partial [Bacteroidota bacterium]|nr:phosphopantothenoylcysteine decarboxylase [Bacteroidota bacterium]